ncbi:MAG TPA: 3'-5' exonuclease [Candidatus Paceibacterota bacterium]|nr:3'-5' exonuclease [Candidatus Paceibacterota bacterium]
MNLIFLDTETTGNDLAQDRLCQVCYKINGEIHTEYFKPPVPISIKSSSITHITNKMVEDKEPFAESQMKKELEKLLPENVLVAHNAKFDIAILKAEGLQVPNFICTLRIAHHLDINAIIPEYNLQFLRYYLELEIEGGAHDAEGDVKVLEAVFNRQFQKMKEEGLNDDEVIKKMIEISKTPVLFKKFSFGKHKDKMIAEVAKTDRGYLDWLLRQKLEDGEEDEDWIYTLNHYLGKLI